MPPHFLSALSARLSAHPRRASGAFSLALALTPLRPLHAQSTYATPYSFTTFAIFGVGGPLSDPKLTLNQDSTPIATNGNRADSPALRDAMAAVGTFAPDPASKDAALLITLAPSSCTAQATGVGNTAEAALVEVYEVP